MRISILDEITVHPGAAEDFETRYRNGYMPSARRRGMRLDGAWKNPPVFGYDELPTTLYYLWSVENVSAWWDMRKSRLPDGTDERFSKHAFWQQTGELVVSRSRKFLSPLPGQD